MSLERALVPLAVAIAVIALAVWLMLVNDIALGQWLLALLVFAHGWVHLMFVFPSPESADEFSGPGGYPFDFGRSWLLRRGLLDGGLVRTLGIAIMLATFGLGLLAALSTLGLVVPADWWAVLMVGAAVASAVMLALFFSPALILGFAIDGLIVALVVSGTWSPV
jgi:hypothetical protein